MPLRLFVAGICLIVASTLLFGHGRASPGVLILTIACILPLFLLLLRGSRVAWTLTLAVALLAVVPAVVHGRVSAFSFTASFIALLTTPTSRAFVWRNKPAPRELHDLSWASVPWPLWGYMILGFAAYVAVFILEPVRSVGGAVIWALFVLTWNYFLLRGLRIIWLITLALASLSFVLYLVAWTGHWYYAAWSLSYLVLLLHPATRHFFRKPEAATPAQA